ncbi:MAG: CBS domain-containing protein [Acidobacteriaceae bacterium]|nr:CBS domain-containing protein [Acidobacteriaceae bacterium]
MNRMLGSSLPLGKVLGVDVRMHVSFVLLLVLAGVLGVSTTGSVLRGLGVWCALFLAVLVREIARAIVATACDLNLRALLLFPVGGIMAFAPRQGSGQPKTRVVSATGPIANLLAGLLLLATAYAFQPGLHLFAQPWISCAHVLRSFVWMQFLVAVVGMLPAALPERKLFARAQDGSSAPASPTVQLGSMLALGAVLLGLATPNLWLVILGSFFFLLSQMGNTGAPQAGASAAAPTVRVRDVMLTEYTLLSSSDTLSSALAQAVHSLQDVFPVVRGDRLVGSIARSTLLENLQQQGDGYLQGVMTKTLHSASPEEGLVEALQRSATLGASEFIPVVEDGAMLGILTPQALHRGVQFVTSQRPQRPGQA